MLQLTLVLYADDPEFSLEYKSDSCQRHPVIFFLVVYMSPHPSGMLSFYVNVNRTKVSEVRLPLSSQTSFIIISMMSDTHINIYMLCIFAMCIFIYICIFTYTYRYIYIYSTK